MIQLPNHDEGVHARKEEIEITKQSLSAHASQTELHKHEHAADLHKTNLESKSKAAHKSSEDVSQARARKELHDAILDSESHMKAHEKTLKNELAQANRADHLNAIKEKQQYLQ